MSKRILELARIYAPSVEPMQTILTLSSKHRSAEMAEILGIAKSTLTTFLSKNGIKAQKQDPKKTGEKISAARHGIKNHIDDKVILFRCDVQSHGCGQNKPIMLRDVHNPKICDLCAKNRRRNLV